MNTYDEIKQSSYVELRQKQNRIEWNISIAKSSVILFNSKVINVIKSFKRFLSILSKSLRYTRKNATNLLQPVAPSGLIQVWYHSCIRLLWSTDCWELTVSDWNSLLGCHIDIGGIDCWPVIWRCCGLVSTWGFKMAAQPGKSSSDHDGKNLCRCLFLETDGSNK